ncbi:MAG: DNA-3-methyladenine glycosylase I [Brevinema sp.]
MNCSWPKTELEIQYHHTEWGIPKHDDEVIFEFLILEIMQAGLSWSMILNKRESLRKAFSYFHIATIAQYTDRDIARLLQNKEIIRNRRKISAVVNNAQKFIDVQAEFGSFDTYVWNFVSYYPIQNTFYKQSEIPTFTPLSKKISKELKRRGFLFIGPTICYSFMQAIGMTNDHLITCEFFDNPIWLK